MVVDAAVRSLRTRGTCAVLGVTQPGVTVPIDIGHLGGGRTVTGVTEGSADPQQFVPYLVQQLIEGRLPIERISRYYDLKDINQAMRDSEAGITVKPIIRISEV
jgi:aryl-alcohol dehydrogenase